MRRSLLAIVLGSLLLASSPMRAQELVYTRFADYIEALRTQIGIPGIAAAIVGRSDVLWERGFGAQDIARAMPMRADTPMHLDGITQVFTATALLRCAEENRLSLDDTVGTFKKDAPEPGATIRQLLSHTSGTGPAVSFSYRPDRIDALGSAVKACAGDSFRETTANTLERLAMANSVPGPDILTIVPPAEGIPTPAERLTYAGVLEKLATPYAVDSSKRAVQVQFASATLSASSGLISTVHDYAQFDLALRNGVLLEADTLNEAWRAPIDGAGKALPHGLGWFVQSYNGQPVVWQFGTGGESGSSSIAVTLPARGVTLVLMANSTGLVKSFQLEKGDVTTSPFARIFLSLFTR
jgi:CubicO group peptidase (beta-lactamase class C family)